MRVEAFKRDDGLFIPVLEAIRGIRQESVVLDITVVDESLAVDYSALDQLVGLCHSGIADGSVEHDRQI